MYDVCMYVCMDSRVQSDGKVCASTGGRIGSGVVDM